MESKAMKTIRNMIARALGDDGLRSRAARPLVRREPLCEALEGRQLLSTAASTVASGMPAWVSQGAFPDWSGHAPTAAEIAQFHAKGGVKGSWTADFAHSGKHGSFTPPAMSATLKADFTTLQNDEKQLRSELPSSVTSAVAADQAVISKALASLAPPKHDGKFMAPPSTLSSPPSGGMTTMLEQAGISAAQATQIATDFQTYQTDLKTIDPTLQAKIAADEAAIAQAGGPTLPTGGGMVFFGRPMNGTPSA
jgi:hypothetical protein